MKRIFLLAQILILTALSIPLLFHTPESGTAESKGAEKENSTQAPTDKTIVPREIKDSELHFKSLIDGIITETSLLDYLPGAVAGEMPTSFEPEALKAQAVAARTYIICCTGRTNPNHPDADVCNDPGCCKMFIQKEALQSMWGDEFQNNWEIMSSAVTSTDGVYISYNGTAIQAVFHSSSFGRTENSQSIWQEIPYLVSVDSPETAEDVPNFESTVEVSRTDFCDTIKSEFPEALLEGEGESFIGAIENTESGRVSTVEIGGVLIEGGDLRKMFGLRSTSFTVEFTGESFLFTCRGYGHGVGMSQYGANVMAKNGSDYLEILKHYYPETEINGVI